jgi:hypothetical protein
MYIFKISVLISMNKENIDIPHPYPEPSPRPNSEDLHDAEVWRKCLMCAGLVIAAVLIVISALDGANIGG